MERFKEVINNNQTDGLENNQQELNIMSAAEELKDIKALNVSQNKICQRGVFSSMSLRLHCWFNSLNQQQRHVLHSILFYHQNNSYLSPTYLTNLITPKSSDYNHSDHRLVPLIFIFDDVQQ